MTFVVVLNLPSDNFSTWTVVIDPKHRVHMSLLVLLVWLALVNAFHNSVPFPGMCMRKSFAWSGRSVHMNSCCCRRKKCLSQMTIVMRLSSESIPFEET